MILRVQDIKRLSARMLPFADAASDGLPMGQLLRLSLFLQSLLLFPNSVPSSLSRRLGLNPEMRSLLSPLRLQLLRL